MQHVLITIWETVGCSGYICQEIRNTTYKILYTHVSFLVLKSYHAEVLSAPQAVVVSCFLIVHCHATCVYFKITICLLSYSLSTLGMKTQVLST